MPVRANPVARLSIKNFSCLETANITLSQVTVLIGPQGSGKSIISKVLFFCFDILDRQFSAIEDGKTLKDFKSDLVEDFNRWFPAGAWGRKAFNIALQVGPYTVTIRRSRSRNNKLSERVRISFSKFFETEYTSSERTYRSTRKKLLGSRKALDAEKEFDLIYRVQNSAERRLRKVLGEQFTDNQLFVPAGRSFFTTVGKAIAAFERGGFLDPLTIKFGRLFTSMRERGFLRRRLSTPRDPKTAELFRKFFGGRLQSLRDQEYVETDDGRKIPFETLSSGQQELLPLLSALESSRFRERGRTYIEEPEAHLFPAAQSDLVDYLVDTLSWSTARHLVITTHSPYILSRLNVLMKLAQIAHSKPQLRPRLDKIHTLRSAPRPRSVAAYAIVDRKVANLIGKSGLIDAEYLDAVSNDLANEFDRLLEIEYSK